MKRIIRQSIVILAISVAMPAMVAKEGGDQYPNGAENWFAGALPPQGTYFIDYFGYYTGQLRDGLGDQVRLGGSKPSVSAVFDAVRFVHVTRFKVFGADWGVHVIAPVVSQSMDLGGRNSRVGIGDLIVDPLILGWHRERWSAVAGLDVGVPTGHFDKNDPRVSIGANYLSFEPVFAFTCFPKGGWETSAKLMYNTKTTNARTNYHSGDEFHADYVVGRHIGAWSIGVSGYALKQLTDDTVAGRVLAAAPGLWSAGRTGQVLAFGPSVAYTNKRHMTFIAQWQHETLVRNRFGGDKLWFKIVVPI
ncbi:MAG: transporter [Bryobacteraceae bacterium]|jgi:hypothetical protein